MLLSDCLSVSPVLVHTLQQLSDSGKYVYNLDAMDAWYEALGESGVDDHRHVATHELIHAVFDDDTAKVKDICGKQQPLVNCAVAQDRATLLEAVLAKDSLKSEDVDMVKILIKRGASPNLSTHHLVYPMHINLQKQTLTMIEDFFWRERINMLLMNKHAVIHTSDAILGLRKGIFPSLSQIDFFCQHSDLLLDSCVFGLTTLARQGSKIREQFPNFFDLIAKHGIHMAMCLCHTLEDHEMDVCPSIIELAMLPQEMLGYLGERVDTLMITLLRHTKKFLTMHCSGIRSGGYPLSMAESTVYSGHVTWFIMVTTQIKDSHEQGLQYLGYQQNPTTGSTLCTSIMTSPLDFWTKMQMLSHLKRLGVFMHGKDRLSLTPLMHACGMKTVIGVHHPLELMRFFLDCDDTPVDHHCGFSNGMAVSPMSIVLETSQYGGDMIEKIMVLDEYQADSIQNKDHFLLTAVHRSLYTKDIGMLEMLSDMFLFDNPTDPKLHNILASCMRVLPCLVPDIERFLSRMGVELKKSDAIPNGRQSTAIVI
jgi:hypothetical protein